VSSAMWPCRPIQLKPASAAMNARFVRAASKQFFSTFAQTVAAALFQDQFAPPPIGRATIACGKTRRALGSGIARSTRRLTRYLRQPSDQSRLRLDNFGGQVRHLTGMRGGGRSSKAALTALFLRTENRSCAALWR